MGPREPAQGPGWKSSLEGGQRAVGWHKLACFRRLVPLHQRPLAHLWPAQRIEGVRARQQRRARPRARRRPRLEQLRQHRRRCAQARPAGCACGESRGRSRRGCRNKAASRGGGAAEQAVALCCMHEWSSNAATESTSAGAAELGQRSRATAQPARVSAGGGAGGAGGIHGPRLACSAAGVVGASAGAS